MGAQRSYTDAELAELDLGDLLAGGVADAEGDLRPELQGHGAVAAAIQLENHMVDPGEVARVVAALRDLEQDGGAPAMSPPPEPAVDRLVRLGWMTAATPQDRAAFTRWLGSVAVVMVVRSRSEKGG